MDPSVRRAIARIEVTRDSAAIRRGTGCLVGDRLVLTALHVVADRTTDPPGFLDGTIELTFTTQFSTVASVLEGKWNALEDWVLLSCAAVPHSAKPLPLAAIDRDHIHWMSYGFPDLEQEGLTIHGTVTNSRGELFGGRVAAYQLYSPEVAAAQGLRAKGLSGAPVIVRGRVIGIIRRGLLEGEHAGAGTLFASPVALVANRCPEYFPDPLQAISVATSPPWILVLLRRSATLLASTMLLALVLWYLYGYLLAPGERATPEETTLLVVLAGAIVLTAFVFRGRGSEKKASNQ